MSTTKPPKSDADGQRIAKLLARAGVASRREIERMIAEGRIALNGVALDTPATILKSLHGITVDGKPVAEPAPARLFRYHKSAGLLTAERDFSGRPTIYDRMPEGLPRVMPVGRLDLNTEGLLLLTTDGELKRQLELPASGVERSYRARAYGPVTQEQLEDLMLGVEIDGVRYGPINANIERRTGANLWIELTLTEGKNREVRRVLEYLGLEVSRLIRTRYGPFYLGDLPVGDVDEIRRTDLITFRTVLSKPGGGKAASNLQFAVRQRVEALKPKPTPVVEPEGRRRIAKPVAPPKKPSFTPRNTPKPGSTGDDRAPAAGNRTSADRRPRRGGDAEALRPIRKTIRDGRPANRSDAATDRPARSRPPRGGEGEARPSRTGTLGLREQTARDSEFTDRAGAKPRRTGPMRDGGKTASSRRQRPAPGGDRPGGPRKPRPGGGRPPRGRG
ncbi:pseudouridine synthase [Sphingomonas sp. RS6]